jgi:hypothetical protein
LYAATLAEIKKREYLTVATKDDTRALEYIMDGKPTNRSRKPLTQMLFHESEDRSRASVPSARWIRRITRMRIGTIFMCSPIRFVFVKACELLCLIVKLTQKSCK